VTRAFTLIELAIVLAIVGIIAAIAIPNMLAARERARPAAPPRMTAEYIEGVGTVYTDTRTGKQYFRPRERDALIELAPAPAEAKP
jgi:prepilin-type N-terminal cleavage/methylation domain-containing protein